MLSIPPLIQRHQPSSKRRDAAAVEGLGFRGWWMVDGGGGGGDLRGRTEGYKKWWQGKWDLGQEVMVR